MSFLAIFLKREAVREVLYNCNGDGAVGGVFAFLLILLQNVAIRTSNGMFGMEFPFTVVDRP